MAGGAAVQGGSVGGMEAAHNMAGPASAEDIQRMKRQMKLDTEITNLFNIEGAQPTGRVMDYLYFPEGSLTGTERSKITGPLDPALPHLTHELSHAAKPQGKLNPLRWNRELRFSRPFAHLSGPLRGAGSIGQLVGAATGSEKTMIPSMIASGMHHLPVVTEEARANLGTLRNLAKFRGGFRNLRGADILTPAVSMGSYLGAAAMDLLPGILGMRMAKKDKEVQEESPDYGSKSASVLNRVQNSVEEITKEAEKPSGTAIAKNLKKNTTDERMWKKRPALIGKKNLGRKRLMDPGTENSSRKLYKALL